MCTRESHERAKHDTAAWLAMVYIGTQRIPADETGPAEALELRNCACGSTLCRKVKP